MWIRRKMKECNKRNRKVKSINIRQLYLRTFVLALNGHCGDNTKYTFLSKNLF